MTKAAKTEKKMTAKEKLIVCIIVSIVCIGSLMFSFAIADNKAPLIGCAVAVLGSVTSVWGDYIDTKRREAEALSA